MGKIIRADLASGSKRYTSSSEPSEEGNNRSKEKYIVGQ